MDDTSTRNVLSRRIIVADLERVECGSTEADKFLSGLAQMAMGQRDDSDLVPRHRIVQFNQAQTGAAKPMAHI
jgi:hypothetical protein